MAKTLVELDDTKYEELVLEVAEEAGLTNYMDFKIFGLAKVGKDVIKVQKANELAERAWEQDDIVVVSLFEPIFDMVDPQTQRIWIENALAQVAYDTEKDRLLIGKEPSINLTLGMYDKYNGKGLGDTLIQKIQLQALSVSQYKDAEREKKRQEKEAKKAKKNQK